MVPVNEHKDEFQVIDGRRFRIRMTSGCYRQYRTADARKRANIERWMKLIADHGADAINDDEKFRFEGRYPDGTLSGRRVAIYAFKAWSLRVYGGFVGGDFLCVEVDLAKKKNKANPALLTSAARKIGERSQEG